MPKSKSLMNSKKQRHSLGIYFVFVFSDPVLLSSLVLFNPYARDTPTVETQKELSGRDRNHAQIGKGIGHRFMWQHNVRLWIDINQAKAYSQVPHFKCKSCRCRLELPPN